MKLSHIGVFAVMLLVIAVACAGCTSTQTSTPSGGSGQAAAASSGSGASSSGASSGSGSSSGGSPAAGSSVSASSLFGGLSYNWIEYKMSTNAGGKTMTMYIKYTKGGACSMRFDPPIQGMPATMDCSSTGGKTVSNPNDVSSTPSNVQFTYVGPDVVTVPAGTYTADKYTATMQGNTVTYWVVKGTGLVKMEGGGSGQGSMTMELNAIGQ
jgi:hypothetical protein